MLFPFPVCYFCTSSNIVRDFLISISRLFLFFITTISCDKSFLFFFLFFFSFNFICFRVCLTFIYLPPCVSYLRFIFYFYSLITLLLICFYLHSFISLCILISDHFVFFIPLYRNAYFVFFLIHYFPFCFLHFVILNFSIFSYYTLNLGIMF